jgi:hypothetical protein
VKDRNLQIEHLPSVKSSPQFLLLWAIATWLILCIPNMAVAQGEPRQESEGVSSTSARPQNTELPGAEQSPAVTQGPPTYGKAEKAGLSYAGTPAPRNILLLGFSSGSSYDDNIFANNQNRVGDVDFLFGPNLSLHRDGRILALALSYQPYFRIYRRVSEPNAVDQTLALDATYQATPRFSLRARGSAYYTTGLFQPSQNGDFVPGLGSPSSLNSTIYTPVTRELTWSSRGDATYLVRAHDSIGVFAGDSRLDFMGQVYSAGNLYNTEERQAGLLYEHRLSPHTTFGTNYLFEDIRFGVDSRTLVHSVFLSYAQQVSRSVTLSVFGGPQYTRLHEIVILPFGPFRFQLPLFQVGWYWSLGGTLTKQLNETVVQLTAQRQVSNGGGFVGAVVGSSAVASIRRRLPWRWDATWSGSYARNTSVASGSYASEFQSETAGFSLARSLGESLSFSVGYNYLRQRGTGQLPYFASFDRNLYSAQLSYRFHQISLGR